MTAHWGIDDPAAAKGSDADKRKAFVTAFTQLSRRISLFISLPVEKTRMPRRARWPRPHW